MESITLLKNKRILLGVTGSCAVYKAVDLASKLTQVGALVDVIMTDSAQKFVLPITFSSVTGRPVYTSMWHTDTGGGLPTHIAHLGLGEGTDLFMIAPITANTIAKLAAGMADDLLSITALAARCSIVIAPAMDGGMYEHPATQANLHTLASRGVTLIEPEIGRAASGMVSKGRFPDTPTLVGHMRSVLGRDGMLAGRKIVVTAGGTREAVDPVRYLTTHSSGKQGHALAQAALDAGAEVVLVSAAQHLPVPLGADVVPVNSAEEMCDAVLAHITGADALLKAAAVADFRPANVADQKIEKTSDPDEVPSWPLSRTPDILLAVKEQRETSGWPRVMVGFAAESQNLLDNALDKLERKGLDLIVANDITAKDAGFAADTNRVVILDAYGGQEPLDLASKAAISEHVIARVAALLES